MHIEHINISGPMDLLVKTKEFYCDVFSLVEGFRPGFSRAGFWLYSDGKPLIHLTESNEHFPDNMKQGCFDHFAFQVTGLEEILRKLSALDISYQIEHLREIGMTQIFLKDPTGTGVEANFVNEVL